MEIVVASLLSALERGVLVVDPLFVHRDDLFAEHLEVFVMFFQIVYVLFELLLLDILLLQLGKEVLLHLNEAGHLELQVLHNQLHVGLDSAEVLYLLFHLGGLFLQIRAHFVIWLDVLLKLLDLVVQHKFELLQFLRLLHQLRNTLRL